MGSLVPIYKSVEETWRADACAPLLDATRRGEIRMQALVHGHYPGRSLPAGVLPGLKTAGYWDAATPQRWGLPPHRNEGIELTFVETGRLAFGADGREYTLDPDSLTITRPWQKHHVGNPNVGAGRLHWIILDVDVRRPDQNWRWPSWILLDECDQAELATVLRQTEQPVWKASGELRHSFLAIANAVEQRRTSAVAIRINEVLLLLLDILRTQRPRLNQALSTSRRTVELFLRDLREHPEHLTGEWTLEGMAGACGLGITRYTHLVRQIANRTPLEYLNDCRLEHAMRQLAQSPRPTVTEIAQSCGYSSSQYFATAFARRFGCSPSVFHRRWSNDFDGSREH